MPDAVCGHSIGELPALAVAGVLADDEVVALAARRGAAMAAAAAARPTGMSAVLGGDADAVAAAVEAAGLQVATVNVAGQVVVGGDRAALDALAAAPPAGARVRPLDVAGAFHTRAMAPARDALEQAVAALTPAAPRCTVHANADGAAVADGAELLSPPGRPAHRPRPLRPLPGGARRLRRPPGRRGRPRRHPRRDGQARPARRLDRRPQGRPTTWRPPTTS